MADPAPSPIAQPDVMNDPAYDTNTGTDNRLPGEGDTCRICRSEGTEEEPLFYPCKCSGSIKFVHQDCLMEWLSHSNKKHCELCKTPFRFTKLYDSQMPETLPWNIFLRRAGIHTARYVITWARAVLVSFVWLIVLPWSIRWAWRALFWFMDAGWARDAFLGELETAVLENAPNRTSNSSLAHLIGGANFTMEPAALSFSRFVLLFLGLPLPRERNVSSHAQTRMNISTMARSTILSDVASVNSLTSSPFTNRQILDVMEGQIITLLVVIAFILVFLIREWVVQQQPLLNAAAQIRDAEVRVQLAGEAVERIRQLENMNGGREDEAGEEHEPLNTDALEEELGDSASQTTDGTHITSDADTIPSFDDNKFMGWEALQDQIHQATSVACIDHPDSDVNYEHIAKVAKDVMKQIELAQEEGIADPVDKIGDILQRIPPHARSIWCAQLLDQVRQKDWQEVKRSASPNQPADQGDSSSAGQDKGKKKVAFDSNDDSGPSEAPLDGWTSDSDRSRLAQQDDWPEGIGDRIRDPDPIPTLDSDSVRSDSTGEQSDLLLDASLAPGSDEESVAGDVLRISLTDQDRGSNARPPSPTMGQPPKSTMQRIFDWFWGEIIEEANGTNAAPAPAPDNEEILPDVDDEDPLVRVLGGGPQAVRPVIQEDEAQDPEVLAAAQQAGLDAEAIEDAEDLEGILELIGMQGPLVGLLQTAVFCGVLITVTLWGAIAGPYLFGKLALVLIGDPLTYLVMGPLKLVNFGAELVVDAALFLGSISIYWIVQPLSALIALVVGASYGHAITPPFASVTKSLQNICQGAALRLSGLLEFFPSTPGESEALLISIQAHQSLRHIQGDIRFLGASVETLLISLGEKVQDVSFSRLVRALFAWTPHGYHLAQQLTSVLQEQSMAMLTHVKANGFTMKLAQQPILPDPSLAYWSATDRCLAVILGYAFLAMIGAAYLLRREPLFSNPSVQKIEKSVSDFLKQAGGVMKVILIISIEMLVFPLYCGLLLDCALLPLFANASVAKRIAFAVRSPWLFAFVHWFIGTCYMFHFALFVSMCRRILRSGVLYFIRDPDDPTFHPVRDVLERNVTTQLRKIAFSALVYGALVILCLGGVVWCIDNAFPGVFPVRWASPEPILEFPIDFLAYNFLAPVLIKIVKPSEGVETLCEWWLRRCARLLRLSDFLFHVRNADEEGHYVRKTWISLFRAQKANVYPSDEDAKAWELSSQDVKGSEDQFIRDGRYVRAPASDQVRIAKGRGVFLEVTEDNERVDGRPDNDEGMHGKRDSNFTKVYIPPWFRVRIGLFIVVLLAAVLPSHVHVNDIYAYSLGFYLLGSVLYTFYKSRQGVQYINTNATAASLTSLIHKVKTVAWRTVKCIYVYGFATLAIPCMAALVLQLYLIIPLHTYSNSASKPAATFPDLPPQNRTSITSASHDASPSTQQPQPLLANHTIHIFQDWALGFLYAKLSSRLIFTGRNNRPATAFRMIKRDGFSTPTLVSRPELSSYPP
ncbi:hypothetical protein H2203_004558 [Taxawa tesnikishii (nom. ined.)]|nr:hypothetical protein H2203_004558 [Dothideales sp. JES 119]